MFVNMYFDLFVDSYGVSFDVPKIASCCKEVNIYFDQDDD
jgi:hypothetical protein